MRAKSSQKSRVFGWYLKQSIVRVLPGITWTWLVFSILDCKITKVKYIVVFFQMPAFQIMGHWVTDYMKKYGSLGESSCNCKKYGVYGWQRCWKRGSFEPYIRVTSRMGLPPPPRGCTWAISKHGVFLLFSQELPQEMICRMLQPCLNMKYIHTVMPCPFSRWDKWWWSWIITSGHQCTLYCDWLILVNITRCGQSPVSNNSFGSI